RPGRVFVVENYAPLSALRPAREGHGGRELAWHARDDRAPGRALWALWARHVGARLRERAHRVRDARPDTPPPARARVVRQASAPTTHRTGAPDRPDEDRAGSH
ncbi:ATP-grasp domain-containing protein, partial [Streptomyces scabiei]